MLGVRLEPELEQRLERLARETGRTKSYYAKEAIRSMWKTVKTTCFGLRRSRSTSER